MAMKRTKEFENILNECLERLLIKGETLEQCLARYPEQAAELKPLLEMALTAKRASAIQPRPEFKARARYQFQAALQGMKVKRGLFPLAWPRWATVVAVAIAVVLASGGTVAASANSMPDQPLYPVKLATEQVRLALTPSDISKAELYAKLVDRRVTEIANIVDKGEPERVDRVARRLDAQLARIALLARARARDEQAGTTRTPALAPAPVPSPRTAAGEAETLSPRDKRLARLRMTVARYAIRHPAELRAMLKTAPESAKPALRRALAIAEARYQQALEAVQEPERDR
jgi:hypothetical protein